MPTVSLVSFLKILTKGTPQKVQAYSKYLLPGGYDFYWRLKDAAHNLTIGGESLSECSKDIGDATNEVERKHNTDGLHSLAKWLKKYNVTQFFEAPVGIRSSSEGHLTIKLEPEFGIVLNGQRILVQLWNSKGSKLTKTAAGVGIFLLERGLAVGDFADCKGAILDLRRRELLRADKLPPNIEAIVASELAWADGFFKLHKKAA